MGCYNRIFECDVIVHCLAYTALPQISVLGALESICWFSSMSPSKNIRLHFSRYSCASFTAAIFSRCDELCYQMYLKVNAQWERIRFRSENPLAEKVYPAYWDSSTEVWWNQTKRNSSRKVGIHRAYCSSTPTRIILTAGCPVPEHARHSQMSEIIVGEPLIYLLSRYFP